MAGKTVGTLVNDIYAVVGGGVQGREEDIRAFGEALGRTLASRLSSSREGFTLRFSNLGTPCLRKLWYSARHPELEERLSPSTRIKFLFGDILENLLIFLARLAGHTVTKEQENVELSGVQGHIDGIIDGHLVDVKSASSYGFAKFREHNLEHDDPFGYIAQLGAYAKSLGHNEASFLAIDKQHGHIALDTYDVSKYNVHERIATVQKVLAEDSPPPRHYSDEPDGKSGNRKLGVGCSYCAFKATCWPGLRVFKYAGRPVFLTRVAREPRVLEGNL